MRAPRPYARALAGVLERGGQQHRALGAFTSQDQRNPKREERR